MTFNINLDTLTLTVGAHDTRDDGVCLLEAAAWFASEDHSDHPACVSPVLAAYGRRLNDVLPDDKRQKLTQFVPLMPGTAGDGHDETRGYMALDWLIRTYTPTWLDLAGLTAEAQELRKLRKVVDLSTAKSVGPVVRSARAKASAARAAAGNTAWGAAWDAARDTAWAAARDVAWDAARDTACAAARDTAWAAARGAAWAAARDVAWAAARDAAWDAARDAARDAAWAAAWDALAPTVAALQDSAIQLLNDMINPGEQQ